MKRSAKRAKRKAARAQPLSWTVVHVLGFLVYLYIQTTTDRPLAAYVVHFVGDSTAVSTSPNSG